MSSSSSSVPYVSAQEVSQLVLNRDPSLLVIDVRSSDFAGGNIPRCLNVPSRTFEDQSAVNDLVKRIASNNKLRTVVCHCMRSQMRGPYAARKLASHPEWPDRLQVKILDGGFLAWRKAFKGHEGLWEVRGDGKGSKEVWVNEDPEEEQHSKELRSRA